MLEREMQSAEDIIANCRAIGIEIVWTPSGDVQAFPKDAWAKELMPTVLRELKQFTDALRVRLMALYALRWVN